MWMADDIWKQTAAWYRAVRCSRRLMTRYALAISCAGMLWQLTQWLLYPVDIEFPYQFYLPLLLGSALLHGMLWSCAVPQRWNGRSMRLNVWLKVWLKVMLALVMAVGMAIGPLYLHAVARVATIPARTDLHCSQSMLDATVAMEDSHFYEHNGFDFRAIHRALRANIRAGRIRQGGSTITQQLAKNLFLYRERTWRRKLEEACYTVALERRFSKQRILQLYLETIDYGMGQRGIRNAARFYFRCPPEQLTLSESSMLVGMVPYAPQNWPARERLEQWRETALARIRHWFPVRYPPEAIAEARRIPLEALLSRLPHAAAR